MTGRSSHNLPRELRIGVESALSSHFERAVEILGAEPVGGGCIHPTARLSTDTGDSFFLKWATGPPSDVFDAEADGLHALRQTAELVVPSVIDRSTAGDEPAWLLMEYIPAGRPAPDYGTRLGSALAALHEPRKIPYGWHRANYIGSLAQSNTVMHDWPEFWWRERLEAQLTIAREAGLLPRSDRDWDALESNLPSLLGGAEADGCSLLHGDLWSGNVYAGPDGRPVLIDPAVYQGHREVDLAMTELFGGFSSDFYAAYERSHPLGEGYRSARRHVYQLYPLLVHVNLFGSGYVDGVDRALRRALRTL